MQTVLIVGCVALIAALAGLMRRCALANAALSARLQREIAARDAQAVLLARLLRHSFLNDLQIITGWLQLGNVERASAQAEQVRDRLVREGQLMRIKPAGLVMALLNRGVWAEANGVRMTYVVAADLAGHEVSDEQFAGPLGDALGGLIEALQAAGARACTITIGTADGRPMLDVASDAVITAEHLPTGVPAIALRQVDASGQSVIRLTVLPTDTGGDQSA